MRLDAPAAQGVMPVTAQERESAVTAVQGEAAGAYLSTTRSRPQVFMLLERGAVRERRDQA